MNDSFSSGREIPGQTPAEETISGDTSTDEAPAVGEDLAGGGDAPVEEPAGAPGEGGVTPDEEDEDEGDLVSADDEDEDADSEDEDGDLRSAGAMDGEMRSAGDEDLMSVAPTSSDALPGQPATHARMAAAEASRGEAPFATPAMAAMVDTAGNGKTTVKASVVTAETNGQSALNTAHTANATAAAAWRTARGIDVTDRHTRELRQTTN